MTRTRVLNPANPAARTCAAVLAAFYLALFADAPGDAIVSLSGATALAQTQAPAPVPPGPEGAAGKNKKSDKPAPKHEDKQASPKDTPPAPTLPAGEPVQAPEFQALDHARQAGISTCTDTLARLLPFAIDAPHEAFSFWAPAPEKADDRLFASIAGLRYVQQAAPRSAAVIGAVPTKSGKCDGIGVQVVPSARSCGALQASLLGKGKAVANLTGLPLIESPNGQRFLLLPSAGNGCVIVAVSTLLGR